MSSPRLPGIGAHHSANPQTDEWLTPPDLLRAVVGDYGPFALDPSVPVCGMPRDWPRYADRTLSAMDDGITSDWDPAGDVWLNPPYSDIAPWMARLARHPAGGVALTFARAETRWWFDHVWPHATAVLFIQGRVTFWQVDVPLDPCPTNTNVEASDCAMCDSEYCGQCSTDPCDHDAGERHSGPFAYPDPPTASPARSGHNSGGPSVLIAYGQRAADRLTLCGIPGALVTTWTAPGRPTS